MTIHASEEDHTKACTCGALIPLTWGRCAHGCTPPGKDHTMLTSFNEVDCPHCGAVEGVDCRTPSGRKLPVQYLAHESRFAARTQLYRRTPRRYVLKYDQLSGLWGGDVLVCVQHPRVPGRLTVLFRESDRFDHGGTECDLFKGDVTPIYGTPGKVSDDDLRAHGWRIDGRQAVRVGARP